MQASPFIRKSGEPVVAQTQAVEETEERGMV